MTSQEIYDEMESHWLTFKENHDRFQAKKIKKAASIARRYRPSLGCKRSTQNAPAIRQSPQLHRCP